MEREGIYQAVIGALIEFLDILEHIPVLWPAMEENSMLAPSSASASEPKRDTIFARPRSPTPFRFDREVAEVFDDMLERSIPFYREVQNMILDLVARCLPDGGRVYDLGCSSGNTLLGVASLLRERGVRAELIGVDQSLPLIRRCRHKLSQHHCCIIHRNIMDILPNRSHFTILNYTLQFIPPEDRPLLLKRIYRGLYPGGMIFVSEKIRTEEGRVGELLTEFYGDFKKRNGYSELEICQKREALEKVLIPFTVEEHLRALRAAGFSQSVVLFRWYNFASFLGIK